MKAALAIAAVSVLLVLHGHVNFGTHPGRIAIREYTVRVPDLPAPLEGRTILHLTDLHGKEYGADQKTLLRWIRECEFDAVALTGDLVDARSRTVKPAARLIAGLPDVPIYSVPGNHDHAGDYWSLRQTLVDLGVEVLDNRATRWTAEGEHVWVVGVDDPTTGRADLQRALRDVDDDAPRILLAHGPGVYSSAIREEIALVLVGHTHGGQVRVPFVGAIYVPGQDLLPEYDYGRFTTDETTMIINAGLGESVIPVRLFCPPEIVLITLRGQ